MHRRRLKAGSHLGSVEAGCSDEWTCRVRTRRDAFAVLTRSINLQMTHPRSRAQCLPPRLSTAHPHFST
jgi:hypothetical protein